MNMSRRDFVKLCAGSAAGLGVAGMFHPAVRDALAATLTGERPPVFWVQGQGCTGCTVSLLNNVHPGIAEVLLRIISLDYQPTIMAAEGAQAFRYLLDKASEHAGRFIYIVEGSIPVRAGGRYCVVGEVDHHEYTVAETSEILGRNAAVTVAVGTCSAYGGVPAAAGQRTGAVSVRDFFRSRGIATPVINVPGCPPHPDWMVGTLALLLDAVGRYGLEDGIAATLRDLDENGRPKVFYPNTHLTCPYLPAYAGGRFSSSFADKTHCRFELGCKGPWSGCDSAKRGWNNDVNWCIANALCVGCTQPGFPDSASPFYRKRVS